MARQQELRNEDGFTLIELMVVVLIIAILLAIAVPTFLGARSRAADRAVQSNVRNAMTNQLAIYADQAGFTEDTTILGGADGSLTYVRTLAELDDGPRHVYVELRGAPVIEETVVMGARSSSSRCFWIRYVGGTGEPRFSENDCSAVASVFVESW